MRRNGRPWCSSLKRARCRISAVADPSSLPRQKALQGARSRASVSDLTGDNPITAQAVAKKLGIAEGAPTFFLGKKRCGQALPPRSHPWRWRATAYNDAPALAEADVGIAMAPGPMWRSKSAGITLVKGDLRGSWRARRLSRATMRNIRQICFLAFYTTLSACDCAGGSSPGPACF